MPEKFSRIDQLCVNTIRTLSIDMVQKANSGHPGLPMGAAPMAYVLWTRHLKHNPLNPKWPDRDRFVLSPGHGSALLYSLLHLAGYDVAMDDVKSFRQWGSKTPGHPESFITPGVECTTGPLGQGTANAVGMAIAERMLANYFNRPGHEIVDHCTFALVSDGDLMEGISAETGSLAGHLGLGKLIYIYDSNDISLDGPTSLSFTENVLERYKAYGWQTLGVEDGNTDLGAINAAISEAMADQSRPSIIEVKTTIGYGSPNKQGSEASHGSPLGKDEVVLAKINLGWEWPDETFYVPDNALNHFRQAVECGRKYESSWKEKFDKYAKEFPELAKEFMMRFDGKYPDGWDTELPKWDAGKKVATRTAAGAALNAIAKNLPMLVGGDADLSVSTKAKINNGGSFNGKTGEGRNIHFGVREHAMAAVANGILWHGGLCAFTSTFFVFADYMRPAIRLAAMNKLPVIYCWTHDSIGVGEDGPTHEPVEHLASLRVIPNLAVVRPCDANEAAAAWQWALEQRTRPTALVLSRQDLPVIDREKFADASRLKYGAYILSDAPDGKPQAIIIATGSEVHLALEAQSSLMAEGISTRVVSMPCWEAFEEQSNEYRESVIPSSIKARISIEAASTMGWLKWVGDAGVSIGIDKFGASAPGEKLFEEYGFTAERVMEAVKNILNKM